MVLHQFSSLDVLRYSLKVRKKSPPSVVEKLAGIVVESLIDNIKLAEHATLI